MTNSWVILPSGKHSASGRWGEVGQQRTLGSGVAVNLDSVAVIHLTAEGSGEIHCRTAAQVDKRRPVPQWRDFFAQGSTAEHQRAT